jgi:hypothetical protein
MNPKEREIIKSYGGWTQFMQTYGLKPHDMGDVAEATAILKRMASGK